MRTIALALLGPVCALRPIGTFRTPNARASTPLMQEAPAGGDLGSLFEEKPPPSWGSPEWQWGSADGAAHEVAARVRDELNRPHRRSVFITYAKGNTADLVDLKMALALSCQRARNLGYDEPDGRWEALMEECAAATFEHEGLIELNKLADAVNERLHEPFDAEYLNENPTAVIATGLEQLEFVEKGL